MENCGYMNQETDYYFQTIDAINKSIPSSGFDFSYNRSETQTATEAQKQQETRNENFLEIRELIEESKQGKIKRLKAKIEAVLFLSEKPISAASIAEQAGADLDLVSQCLNQLIQEYEDRESGIIIDCANGYCMQVRDEFEELTQDILPIEIRTAVLRTLSTIALKEPILQRDLVEIRGGGVYEHVKELIDMGLVKKTKDGNSNILHTSKFFTENFKLSQNGIELQKVLKKAGRGEVEFIRNSELHAQEDEETVSSTEDSEKIEEIQNSIQEKEDLISSDNY